MTNQIDTIVKQLAESVTIQSKQANKLWLIMISIAVIVMFPPIMKGGNSTDQVELPFKIGIVSIVYFYPAVFFLYSILIIAFSAAHTQAIRTQKLANSALELIKNEKYSGIYSRDLFDMFRVPGINRTAPLAQLLRGKYQFIDHADDCPCWWKKCTSIYYLILKIISSLVYWLLPSLIYYIAWTKSISTTIQQWISMSFNVIGIIAASAILIVAISDIIYIINVFKVLWSCKRINKSE